MKIAIVLSSTPAYSETFFVSKIKGLQKNGHEPILYVHNKADDFMLCPVVVTNRVYKNRLKQFVAMAFVFLKILMFGANARKFIKIERSQDVPWKEVVKHLYLNAKLLRSQTDWIHFGFATQALGREHVAEAIGAKMAVSFRGFDIAIFPLKHPGCYDLLWKRLDKVHTISNDLLHKAYSLGLPKDIPVHKITPAVDVSDFTLSDVTNENERINFLTVARLNWVKGLVDTLEALVLVKDFGIDFLYTVVGDGNIKERERIAIAIRDLGLMEVVKLAGRCDKREIINYYNDSDIYIQYSISEGFSNAVLEAQACGLLCLVSDAGGLSENIIHEKTGWVVPKSDPIQLASKIIEVAQLPITEKDRFRNTARERVANEFHLKKQEQEFLTFYTS